MAIHHVRILICGLLLLAAAQANATWQENGFIVDSTAVVQSTPKSVSDGQGGMIATWADGRAADYHIYAQRIDAEGNAVWQAGGVPICTYNGFQDNPTITTDGNGGAYIAWEDYTTTFGNHIYAQHINASGANLWTSNGVQMTSGSPDVTRDPVVTDDSDGSAYLAWEQYDGADGSVRVMRLLTGGKAWSSAPRVTAVGATQISNTQIDCTAIGATLAWSQNNTGSSSTAHYRAVDSDGAFPWPVTFIDDEGYTQYSMQMTAGPLGGFFMVWERNGPGIRDIRAAYGSPSDESTPIIKTICDDASTQSVPNLVAVADGAIIAWRDLRYGSSSIFAQKVTPQLNTVWSNNGRSVSSNTAINVIKRMLPDGTGGALIIWLDYATATWGSLIAQQVSSAGYAGWGSTGVPLTTAGYGHAWSSVVGDGNGGLISVWNDQIYSDKTLMIQRLERNGYWGYPAPDIAAVADIAGDQGGKVLVSWVASRLDSWAQNDIVSYSLWRALPSAKNNQATAGDWLTQMQDRKAETPVVRMAGNGDKVTFWELVEEVDAYHLPGYSRSVATHSDHTTINEALHNFQVIAHGSTSTKYWISEVGQGWSVDNLAPAMPAAFLGAASYGPETLNLTWRPNTETDLAHYEVHRGLTPDFEPSAGTLLVAVTDTTAQDTAWDTTNTWYYKVAAVDLHENLSEFALLAPDVMSSVETDDLPAVTSLRGNYPNPFNPSTTIAYDLAAAGLVRLEIFDASGRLVRTLVNENQGAGQQQAVWDGRDEARRNLASGVYLCRLSTDDRVRTRRMTLIK